MQGDVYEAWHISGERKVAVKVLRRSEGVPIPNDAVRELKSLAALADHESVVTLFDVIVVAEAVCLILMWCDGTVGRGQTAKDTTHCGVRLCGALASAADVGIFHGDVKPANVLRDTYGQPRLADFGVAAIPGLPSSGYTRAYAAPERPECDADELSDQFSLARTLKDICAPDELRRHSHLTQVLDRACAQHPDDRYRTAVGFLQALQDVQRLESWSVTSTVYPEMTSKVRVNEPTRERDMPAPVGHASDEVGRVVTSDASGPATDGTYPHRPSSRTLPVGDAQRPKSRDIGEEAIAKIDGDLQRRRLFRAVVILLGAVVLAVIALAIGSSMQQKNSDTTTTTVAKPNEPRPTDVPVESTAPPSAPASTTATSVRRQAELTVAPTLQRIDSSDAGLLGSVGFITSNGSLSQVIGARGPGAGNDLPPVSAAVQDCSSESTCRVVVALRVADAGGTREQIATLSDHGFDVLSDATSSDRSPSVSPDGKQILFSSVRNGNRDVYTMPSQGGAPTRRTTAGTDDDQPSWLPSGQAFIWVSRSSGSPSIQRMTVEDKAVSTVSPPAENWSAPVASPDGTRVLALRSVGGRVSAVVIEVGTLAVSIVPGSTGATGAVWRSDDVVAFLRTDGSGNSTVVSVALSKGERIEEVAAPIGVSGLLRVPALAGALRGS